MKREIDTLSECIQNLIAISDVLESVRKKIRTISYMDMHQGQIELSNAVEHFKQVKHTLNELQRSLYQQTLLDEDEEKRGD